MNNKTIYLYNDNIGKVQYIQHYGNDKMIVNAARVSFGKDNDLPIDERDVKLIKYLIKNKHTSTFEHCGITFKFVVPLFVRSQHHRHRTWAYNEISRRYTNENIEFFSPESFRTQHESNKQASKLDSINPIVEYNGYSYEANKVIKIHNIYSLDLYNKLIECGVCREQARGVLPQNMYTEYYGTVNLNNLFKFFILRDDSHAQLEIQVVARACKEIAKEIWPVAISSFDELKNNIMT